MKRTYQPHNTPRKRTHGFRARMKTKNGRRVINARRAKGRKRLSVQAQSLIKLDSLKTKAEFDFIYKNAKRFFHKHFVLYALSISHFQPHHFKEKKILHAILSRQAALYLGLSISRKIGKANKRNLVKRRIKAIVYENRMDYKDFIFVIVAKEGITCLDFATLKTDLLFGFAKIQEICAKLPKVSYPRMPSYKMEY